MADKRRNTQILLHGAQTKEIFSKTASLASEGVTRDNRIDAVSSRPQLGSEAMSAASRIQNNPASMIRGDVANVSANRPYKTKEVDIDAEKKTPRWTDKFRVG